MIARALDKGSLVSGILCALLVNSLLLGLVWVTRSRTAHKPQENFTFVDAKLVRFGKPRDLSFLPHIKATAPKKSDKALKFTDDPDRKLPKPPEDKDEKPDDRKLPTLPPGPDEPDDRATQAAMEEGSLTGSRGGTATEASGDPFIREIMAAITERWTVPNMLTAAELAKLKATVCLRIDDEGKLTKFEIITPSGNDLFDGSLGSTLGSLPALPKPYGPFARAAHRGKLCPEFSK